MLIRKNAEHDLKEIVIPLDTLFDSLPDEVLLNIIRHIPPQSLTALRKANTKWHALCDDYLFTQHNPETIRWRLRFFRGMRDDLLEDIEEKEQQHPGYLCTITMLVIGSLLTYAGVNSKNQFSSATNSTRSEQILFLIYLLAAIALLINGIIRLITRGQSNYHLNSMYNRLEEIENNIESDSTRLQRPVP